MTIYVANIEGRNKEQRETLKHYKKMLMQNHNKQILMQKFGTQRWQGGKWTKDKISSQNKKDRIETISIQREYYYWQNDNRHNMEYTILDNRL